MFAERRRRRQVRERGFDADWRQILDRRMPLWRTLDVHEQERVEARALDLIAGIRWEAARGFEVTDEVQVLVAGQAALMAIDLPDDSFSRVRTVIVHPTTVVIEGEHETLEGFTSDDPVHLSGQAEYDGPVMLAWDDVVAEARHPGDGNNVVFHEFAHKLDMNTGSINGTPPIVDAALLDRWVDVCTAAFDLVGSGGGGYSLPDDAADEPGEFFAAATEAFFDCGDILRDEHPDLYAVFSDYFGQDPAARFAD
jgi:Mlc titration factor MtfA (ptsG expression regulator)